MTTPVEVRIWMGKAGHDHATNCASSFLYPNRDFAGNPDG